MGMHRVGKRRKIIFPCSCPRLFHNSPMVPLMRVLLSALLLTDLLIFAPAGRAEGRSETSGDWPVITRQDRPWAYWWWHGSAVDRTNLSHELQRYHDAGMGGVHIIPIYRVKGNE